MATVDKSQLSEQEYSSLCCAYAALILHDDKKETTEDNLKKLLSASSNKVNGTFVKMFAKAVEGQDIEELLSSMTAVAPAAPVEEVVTEKKGKADKEEEKKEEKKEEEPEMEGFGGIFGDDE
eukprot:TRINITY_DN0_c2297_g1_i1.p1 TRINITY_DN0_c2297_g1~~TRINITY_DN0_c2297_g1_i1.p1  ORF type:complete len:122 (+),score=64.86 TRINITY_DN0_c2297_g1_i1:91-456(+)